MSSLRDQTPCAETATPSLTLKWVRIQSMKSNGSRVRPSHASYRRHRAEIWTRILLPVLLAALVLAGVVVVLSLSAFEGAGDPSRWAAIATIWLTLPALVVELVLVLGLAAMIFAVGKIAGVIPTYSLRAQSLVRGVERRTKLAGDMIREPMLAARMLTQRIRSAVAGKAERE
jgi:hypothetical protein